MRKLRFFLEAAALRSLLAVSRIVPRRFMLALGSVAGWLGYHLDGRHRRVALENLGQAYGPRLDPGERRRIVRACWRHFGRTTFDSLAIFHMDPDELRRNVRFEGLEHVRQAYARGKGVLVFSGHFGFWELTALAQGYLDMPLAMIARPLDNPALERMLADLRERSGNRIVHKRNAIREMLKALRERWGVAIMIDQDSGREGIFVPFFDRPASTTPTLAMLAMRTGAAVIPTFSVPLDDGTYRVVYEPAIEPPRTGDRARDVEVLTARATAILEDWVRRYPDLWLWMHRRWKSRPPTQ